MAPVHPSLAEELLLFGYDDFGFHVDDGRGPEHEYGLVSAVLVDLALAGRIDVIDGKVCVIDPNGIGDPEADRILNRMATGGDDRRRRPGWWFDQMRMDTNGGRGDLRRRLLDQLVERGIMRLEQHKVFKVLPTRNYFLVDSTVKSAARSRLDEVLHGGEPDARTVTLLLLLLHPCGYSLDDFSDVKRRTLDARLKELANCGWASAVTRKAIQSILDAAEKASAPARSSSGR
jgi:hypothetical protein